MTHLLPYSISAKSQEAGDRVDGMDLLYVHHAAVEAWFYNP
jgi:hypothetical protein